LRQAGRFIKWSKAIDDTSGPMSGASADDARPRWNLSAPRLLTVRHAAMQHMILSLLGR
jgi:hypothetical protein